MKMTTVTIPKTLAQKGDLVLIPRKEYEELQLNHDLRQAIQEYRAGKYYGPFADAKSAVSFLRKHRRSPKQ
ncbi:MAG: hypothetical protein HYT48_02410 [Candidatus Vogelbacteria bacterium]|nr:hypothetical protein [Candidatus Vogelbacteria bacterium]